jgi:peptide/nickel transport system permease protein
MRTLSLPNLRKASWPRVPVLSATIPIVIFFTIALAAIFAPFVAPFDPLEPVVATDAQCQAAYRTVFPNCYIKDDPPIFVDGNLLRTVLGTDYAGRDILSRLIYGARLSLIISFGGTLIAGVIGTLLGLIAGYFGSIWQEIIMRITDAWQTLPPLIFAILLSTLSGPGAGNIILVLAIVFWSSYARLVCAEVMTLKERDFVKLAEITGVSLARILFRHLLPNVLNIVVVYFSLIVGVAIIVEASLSFLGVGMPPPQPAWGLMIAQERDAMLEGKWWLVAWPGICIMLLVLSANMIGDWLRLKLDPHLRNL